MSKVFPTSDVLSTISGYLVSPRGIDCVYKVLNYMTGEGVFTHQLPRISEEARVAVLALHPHLQAPIDDAKTVTRENWREWIERWENEIGPTISVPKMTNEQHEYIDPMSEAAQYFPPDKIKVVTVSPK